MWFTKRPTPLRQDLDRLLDLVDSQARHIHRLETALARATNQPLPGPLRLPSRAPSPSSTSSNTPPGKIRGAEAVSTMDRAARQEEEHRTAVHTAFRLPAYMEAPTPIPEAQIPAGKSVGGGFSPRSEPPPDRNLPSDPRSTTS